MWEAPLAQPAEAKINTIDVKIRALQAMKKALTHDFSRLSVRSQVLRGSRVANALHR
jgi:hypothetical protein